MISLRRSALATFAFVLFSACGSETITEVKKEEPPPPPPPPPVVASVSVAGPTRLVVGRVDTVKATARAASSAVITGRTVSWSSSNTAAVTVGSDGAVRAVAPGTAVVSATVDNVVGSISITASDASIVSLTLTPPANVLVGGTAQIGATARDSVNQPVVIRSIAWTTSSPNVATVSPTGLVTALASGTVTLTATVFGGVANITLTVIPVPVASIVFAPFDSVLHLRFPKRVVASALDSAGNVLAGRALTYSSANVDVATFDAFGLLTASGFRLGTDTVTVSSGGKSASTRYFVPPDSGLYVATVGGVPGDPVSVSIDIPGATFPSTASGLVPADGVSRFTFVTSNGNYRVRSSTSVDPARSAVAPVGVALLIGSTTTAVPVTLGPPSTIVSIPMAPYSATITAPASAVRGATVSVSWTFDESRQPFSFFPDAAPTGTLWWSTTSGIDLSGTPVAATVTRDPTTFISTFTATFVAPSTAATVYLQVEGDGPVARLLFPIVFRGQSLKTISIP